MYIWKGADGGAAGSDTGIYGIMRPLFHTGSKEAEGTLALLVRQMVAVLYKKCNKIDR